MSRLRFHSTYGNGLIDLTDKSDNLVEQIFYENPRLQISISSSQGQFPNCTTLVAARIYSKCQHCQERPQGEALSVSCPWCQKAFYCSEQCLEGDQAFHGGSCFGVAKLDKWPVVCQPKPCARMGLTGIRNISNSCYLSASLQCLSHAVGLTNYFLKGQFRSELNPQNPLGTGGKIAIGYAKLLKELWFDTKESIAPVHLKSVIAKFKKQFNNSEQQDSQELLSVLLDGLHEDLNRVRQKPLVPVLESDGTDDTRAARESWKNHLKRNQSIIVDMMHGLYKSTVQCPDCNKVSVTFEPYMNLTLPIPEIKMVTKQFFFVPRDTSAR